MTVHELVTATRSIRRFKQDPVSMATLRELVDLGRLSASGGNLQPLKYFLACDTGTNSRIFPCTQWAGYLKDWPGPAESERPTAYIVILHDAEISTTTGCDHGIAAQSIVLGACERGLGACMIGSIHRSELIRALGIPARYKVSLIIALGVPAETVMLEPVDASGCIEYYRDPAGVHHVPKRSLDSLIVTGGPMEGG